MSSSGAEPLTDPATTANRYKTELCRSFEELGVCRYGDKCQYAHGYSELRSLDRHPRHKTELCRSFHTTGLCSYGYRCNFIHNEAQNLVTSLEDTERGRFVTSLEDTERSRFVTSLEDTERSRFAKSLDDAERGRRKIKERILGLIARNVLHQQLLHAISGGVSYDRPKDVLGQSSLTDTNAFGRLVVSAPSMRHQHEPITIPDVHRTPIGVGDMRQSSRRLDYSSSPDSPSFLCTSLSSVSSNGGASQTWSSTDDAIPSPTWSSFEDSVAAPTCRHNSRVSVSPYDSFVKSTADELTTKYRFF